MGVSWVQDGHIMGIGLGQGMCKNGHVAGQVQHGYRMGIGYMQDWALGARTRNNGGQCMQG